MIKPPQKLESQPILTAPQKRVAKTIEEETVDIWVGPRGLSAEIGHRTEGKHRGTCFLREKGILNNVAVTATEEAIGLVGGPGFSPAEINGSMICITSPIGVRPRKTRRTRSQRSRHSCPRRVLVLICLFTCKLANDFLLFHFLFFFAPSRRRFHWFCLLVLGQYYQCKRQGMIM